MHPKVDAANWRGELAILFGVIPTGYEFAMCRFSRRLPTNRSMGVPCTRPVILTSQSQNCSSVLLRQSRYPTLAEVNIQSGNQRIPMALWPRKKPASGRGGWADIMIGFGKKGKWQLGFQRRRWWGREGRNDFILFHVQAWYS
jgi:hypothetical protein